MYLEEQKKTFLKHLKNGAMGVALADLLAALGNGEQSILIAAFYMDMQYHLKSILRVI